MYMLLPDEESVVSIIVIQPGHPSQSLYGAVDKDGDLKLHLLDPLLQGSHYLFCTIPMLIHHQHRHTLIRKQ